MFPKKYTNADCGGNQVVPVWDISKTEKIVDGEVSFFTIYNEQAGYRRGRVLYISS